MLTKGQYNKTLRTCNLQEIDKFRRKLESFLLSVTNTLAWTNTLAYHGICTLRVRNVFILQKRFESKTGN
jgi:hypothetical protein